MANFKKDLQRLKVEELKAGQMKEWNQQGDKSADTRLWRCGGCFRCGGCGCGGCGCGGCGFGCFGCFFI